ncbi:MAG: hypothetical protein FJ148_23455 [Deltaproteobacteria bacterium]|nr:hypothetical protein [Deltaproteobacteria bacterium]
MVRKLLLLALAPLLVASAAHAAGDLTDAEILALAGPKTCEFGQFPDQAANEISIPLINLEPGITYEYCFKLPKAPRAAVGALINGFIELRTANLANSSCGTASIYVIRPNRKPLGPFFTKANTPRAYASIDQVSPTGGLLRYTPGTWRVLIRGESGFEDKCTRYRVDVTW